MANNVLSLGSLAMHTFALTMPIHESYPDEVACNPNKTHEEILEDIRLAGAALQTPGITIPPFAALLVKLSREANADAKVVIRLTRWIIALTWALAAFTFVLLFATFQLRQIASHTDKQLDEIGQIARAQKATEKKSASDAGNTESPPIPLIP